MNDTYRIDVGAGRLIDSQGRRYDAAARRWLENPADPVGGAERDVTAGGSGGGNEEIVDAPAAVRWLQRSSGTPLRMPIGVIGPRDATPVQMEVSARIGAGLAGMGLTVLCGGRHGVMEAVARGSSEAGGVSIGLLPDATAEHANPYLSHVIATGIGEARNALVARAAFCLVVIGDSYGTLSEVALGLQFGKRVFGIEGAARVHGVEHRRDVDSVLRSVALAVLG